MKFEGRIFGNEYTYVKDVLDSGFRSSAGSRYMTRLEQEFAARFGMPYGISHINGTATLHAVLEAAGIGPWDEVIVPPLTMASTTFAVLQCGATPVFADVDPDTFLMDPKAVSKLVTSRTRAIIPVSLYGLCPDMDPIMQTAHKHNLLVLEDAAQCFLGTYKGRLVGTIGDASSFSLQSSKHVTSGEGGMVLTADRTLAEKIRRVVSLGYAGVGAGKGKIAKQDILSPDYSRHVQMGWNYRIPELCAAVALAQLEHIDELVQRRIDVAGLFSEAVRDISWLVPQRVSQDCRHTYWTWAVKINRPDIDWQDLSGAFTRNGGDRIYGAWKLTYLEPVFRDGSFLGRERFIDPGRLASYGPGLCPNAESIQGRLLQFKTNYWDIRDAETQADILRRTLIELGRQQGSKLA